MKKFILISVLVLASSGALAQSSQGQGGAQAGTNGNVSTTPNSPAMQNGMREGGTTGINSGAPNNANSSQAHQPSATGPSPQAPAATR
jgi:hypothetical protein